MPSQRPAMGHNTSSKHGMKQHRATLHGSRRAYTISLNTSSICTHHHAYVYALYKVCEHQ
eukprot:6206923-Pleurochrysis_carterae.AAC.1